MAIVITSSGAPRDLHHEQSGEVPSERLEPTSSEPAPRDAEAHEEERTSLAPGTRVLDAYVLHDAIEANTHWRVYRGAHVHFADGILRVRVLRREAALRHGLLDELSKHAPMLEELLHGGLVPVIATGRALGAFVIVTPSVDGTTLGERLRAAPGGVLPPAEVAKLAIDLAEALNYLHYRAVIHGALDLASIVLVEGDPPVRLLDAGLGHITRAIGLETNAPEPAYRAPEHARGQDALQPASDQFVLASIAFECLTGTQAFPAGPDALSDPEALSQRLLQALPVSLGAVLQRAWAPDPAERFPTTVAFARALASTLANETQVVTKPLGFPQASALRYSGRGSLPFASSTRPYNAAREVTRPCGSNASPAGTILRSKNEPFDSGSSSDSCEHADSKSTPESTTTLDFARVHCSVSPHHSKHYSELGVDPWKPLDSSASPISIEPLASTLPPGMGVRLDCSTPPDSSANPDSGDLPSDRIATLEDSPHDPGRSPPTADAPADILVASLPDAPLRADITAPLGTLAHVQDLGQAPARTSSEHFALLRAARDALAPAPPPLHSIDATRSFSVGPTLSRPALASSRLRTWSALAGLVLIGALFGAAGVLTLGRKRGDIAAGPQRTVAASLSRSLTAPTSRQRPPLALDARQTLGSATAAPAAPSYEPRADLAREHRSVREVKLAIQQGIEACAVRFGRYRRHVFVGIAYEGPTGAPLAVRIAGAPIRSDMVHCIESAARSERAPRRRMQRWSQSYYLYIP